MIRHFAHGLGIQSDLPLPELLDWEGPCKVIFRQVADCPAPSNGADRRGWRQLSREEGVIFFPEIGLFHLRGGREVDIQPAADTRQSLLRLALLGPVFSGLLYQRGNLVLHASAVNINGGAVAFLGGSGFGKSSLAAALAIRGHGIASDDVTPLALDGEFAAIHPGFPRLKVSRGTAEALNIDRSALVELDPQIGELGLVNTAGFSPAPLPLRRVYVLGDGQQPELLPLSPREAMLELTRYTYPTCTFLPGDALHFRQCARLASQVPFLRLCRPDDLSLLPALAELVEANLN